MTIAAPVLDVRVIIVPTELGNGALVAVWAAGAAVPADGIFPSAIVAAVEAAIAEDDRLYREGDGYLSGGVAAGLGAWSLLAAGETAAAAAGACRRPAVGSLRYGAGESWIAIAGGCSVVVGGVGSADAREDAARAMLAKLVASRERSQAPR